MRKVVGKILWIVNLFFIFCLLTAYLSVYISPEVFWLPAFFGLAYPVFFFINASFVVFWLIRWKWYFWIGLFVIILGWNYHRSFIQLRGKNTSKDAETIHVLSYNVRLFNLYGWEKNPEAREQVFDFLQMEEPDIICFQEIYVSDDSSFNTRRLLRELQATPHYQFTPDNSKRQRVRRGLATFSNLPIIHQGAIALPGERSLCIFSDILWGSDTIRVYNNHLQSIMISSEPGWLLRRFDFMTEDMDIEELRDISYRLKEAFVIRAQQVKIIQKHISESPYPVIVCGDFNDTPISFTYQRMRKKLRDAFMESGAGLGKTYRGDFPSYRIDYIFHSRQLQSSGFITHRVDMSDHYPISCVIGFDN